MLPLPKLVARGDTTLADAYLSPVLDRYVASVRRGLEAAAAPRRCTSCRATAGSTAAEHFRGKDSLLSGPAGGVVGMVRAARAVGCDEVIGFDMGGTSTDVALYAGELERTTDAVIAAVRVSAPMLRIQTVAAGGGSILSFGQGRLKVGPESAGALPGPKCYRHGGPLTITDANLLLGRIQPEFFPRVFGPNADEPLDAQRHERGVRGARRATIGAATARRARGPSRSPRGSCASPSSAWRTRSSRSPCSAATTSRASRCAASAAPAGSTRRKSRKRSASGRVIIHPLAGVLSAYGIGVADVRVLRQASVEAPLDAALAATLAARFEPLARDGAREALREQGADAATASRLEHRLLVKVAGADTALPVAWRAASSARSWRAAFRELHVRHFGFRVAAGTALVVESLELEAVVPGLDDAPRPAAGRSRRAERAKPIARRNVWCGDRWRNVPVYDRAQLPPGARFTGPALIVEAQRHDDRRARLARGSARRAARCC